jgi:acetamidase/formamidase
VGVRPGDEASFRDRVLWIDLTRKVIEYAPGVVVQAKPFWGDIGVAPPADKGRWPAACPDIHGGRPRAETATHWMTMALHADLDEAIKIATRDMVDFIVQTKGLDLADAYMLASASMDLAVTQAVDCVKGVHALMPKAVFQR